MDAHSLERDYQDEVKAQSSDSTVSSGSLKTKEFESGACRVCGGSELPEGFHCTECGASFPIIHEFTEDKSPPFKEDHKHRTLADEREVMGRTLEDALAHAEEWRTEMAMPEYTNSIFEAMAGTLAADLVLLATEVKRLREESTGGSAV